MTLQQESTTLTPDQNDDPANSALDGGADVRLAPIRGRDARRTLPKEYFTRNPRRMLAKLGFAFAIIAAGYAVIARGPSWLVAVPILVILGLMYGHLVELQHELLHEHSFNSRRLNRWAGVLCGLFMFSSYSHYKYKHLRHHAFLGTPKNNEFFNYRFQRLNSWPGFLYAAFQLGRYKDVVRDIARSVRGRPIPDVTSAVEARKIRREYLLFVGVLVAAVAVSALTGSVWILVAWLIPTLLVAEATHFLIELPEHYGLNTQTDSNVLTNTRTIRASRFAQWFTNFNNLHTAHHYHQGVPMANIQQLDAQASDNYAVTEQSYPRFYLKIIWNELTQDLDESCMTR